MDILILLFGIAIGGLLCIGIAQLFAKYLEKKPKSVCRTVWPEKDMTGVFAVSDQEAWWLAVHQAIEEVERECIEGSRRYVANTNQCLNAVGAGEGAALVRTRLIEKRELALKSAQPKKLA